MVQVVGAGLCQENFCSFFAFTKYHKDCKSPPLLLISTDLKLLGLYVPVQRYWLVFDVHLLLFVLLSEYLEYKFSTNSEFLLGLKGKCLFTLCFFISFIGLTLTDCHVNK